LTRLERIFPKVPVSGGYNIEKLIDSAPDKTTLVDLELSGSSRCLALVRRLLEASAHSMLLDEVLLNDIKLAVTEACTNVIKHAFKYDPTKKFGITIQISPILYLIRVIYEDAEFKPDSIPLPNLDEHKGGGLGVYIMRNIMDDVVYSTDTPTGTVTLRMVKLLKPLFTTGGPM